jgi:hypothetical protein
MEPGNFSAEHNNRRGIRSNVMCYVFAIQKMIEVFLYAYHSCNYTIAVILNFSPKNIRSYLISI